MGSDTVGTKPSIRRKFIDSKLATQGSNCMYVYGDRVPDQTVPALS
jgi:hypothetical protein